jgi:hypothetical protein
MVPLLLSPTLESLNTTTLGERLWVGPGVRESRWRANKQSIRGSEKGATETYIGDEAHQIGQRAHLLTEREEHFPTKGQSP